MEDHGQKYNFNLAETGVQYKFTKIQPNLHTFWKIKKEIIYQNNMKQTLILFPFQIQ